MAKHNLTTEWRTHKIGKFPCAAIATASKSELFVVVYHNQSDPPKQSLRISRRLARSIAKRINECLDATA